MDTHEKHMMEDLAKEEFDANIEELRKQDGITEVDIEQFKKNALVQRSIDIIKMRSVELAAKRNSASKYSQVKSKVAQCIKVQNKVIKKQRKAANEDVASLDRR